MSVRLLLVTVFTAALTLTVRLADLWQGLSLAAHSVSIGTSAAAADPAKPPGPDAVTNPAPGSPAAPAAPGSAGTAAAAPTAQGDAAKTDAGTAGDKTDTAKGEETAAKPTRDEPDDTLSDAELATLQSLAKRREELDAREKALDTRQGLLAAGEKRVDEKVAELKDLQGKIQALLKTYDEQEKAKMESLVKIYENMRPKDAAPIFEQLDMDTLLDIVSRMKERKVSPILAVMNPAKAKEITDELARRNQLSQSAAAAAP